MLFLDIIGYMFKFGLCFLPPSLNYCCQQIRKVTIAWMDGLKPFSRREAWKNRNYVILSSSAAAVRTEMIQIVRSLLGSFLSCGSVTHALTHSIAAGSNPIIWTNLSRGPFSSRILKQWRMSDGFRGKIPVARRVGKEMELVESETEV